MDDDVKPAVVSLPTMRPRSNWWFVPPIVLALVAIIGVPVARVLGII